MEKFISAQMTGLMYFGKRNKLMNIKITLRYLEQLSNSPVLATLNKKNFGNRLSYQLARIFDALEREIRIYLKEKRKIIEKYAKRYDEDGEQRDGKGRIIKSWKKGDIVSDGQTIILEDAQTFSKAMDELLKTGIDLGLKKVKMDFDDSKIDNLSVEEIKVLLPLIEE